MYDSKDLTTHGVFVGMTGSGKTGLCIGIIEEAAIDRHPGDRHRSQGRHGNLLLTLPDLRPGRFRAVGNGARTRSAGTDPEESPQHRPSTGRRASPNGAKRRRGSARYARAPISRSTRPAATPALPLSVLRSFAVPPHAIRADTDLLARADPGPATGLLALLGIDADPLNSREHILISNMLARSGRRARVSTWPA